MMKVTVDLSTAEAVQEVLETIQSYEDPENSDSLVQVLEGFQKSIIEVPALAVEMPHYLALALWGQIVFNGQHPRETWLAYLFGMKWANVKPCIRATKIGKRICSLFESSDLVETLEMAVKVILLAVNDKNTIRVVSDSEETAGDLYGDDLEGGDYETEEY